MLQPSFNFTSASHPLVSAFRILSPSHSQPLSLKTKDALATALKGLLQVAQPLGPVCVPTLPAVQREQYTKHLLQVQGLVSLASAVARNAPAMLMQVGIKPPPVHYLYVSQPITFFVTLQCKYCTQPCGRFPPHLLALLVLALILYILYLALWLLDIGKLQL